MVLSVLKNIHVKYFFSNDLKASSRVIVEKNLTESQEAIKLPT